MILLLISLLAFDLHLTWNPPGTTNDTVTTNSIAYGDVSGYRLYRSATLSNFTVVATAPANATNMVLTNTVPGHWFFYLTATNIWGESDPSNFLITPPVASKVVGTRIALQLQPTSRMTNFAPSKFKPSTNNPPVPK